MAFRRRELESPRIDLTPMIDVVFLLLIFFMISTTFIESPGLQIDLPKSSALNISKEGDEVQVFLSEKGEIFYKQQQVTLEQLKYVLASFGSSAGRMTFLLMADREARHGAVIRLMDAAKTAGFTKLAIATDKDDNQPD